MFSIFVKATSEEHTGFGFSEIMPGMIKTQ